MSSVPRCHVKMRIANESANSPVWCKAQHFFFKSAIEDITHLKIYTQNWLLCDFFWNEVEFIAYFPYSDWLALYATDPRKGPFSSTFEEGLWLQLITCLCRTKNAVGRANPRLNFSGRHVTSRSQVTSLRGEEGGPWERDCNQFNLNSMSSLFALVLSTGWLVRINGE